MNINLESISIFTLLYHTHRILSLFKIHPQTLIFMTGNIFEIRSKSNQVSGSNKKKANGRNQTSMAILGIGNIVSIDIDDKSNLPIGSNIYSI